MMMMIIMINSDVDISLKVSKLTLSYSGVGLDGVSQKFAEIHAQALSCHVPTPDL